MKIINIFIISLIFLFELILAINLSLDGNDWFATNQNRTIRVSARVPGSVFTDLIRNNVLKEDPYYGSNDYNYKWVSYDNWTYDKTFNVDERVLSKRGIYLVFHGLDTISTIYINDVFIGRTDNQFIRYKFNVKQHLRLSENRIRVAFESAVTYAKRAHDQHVHSRYIVPPESMPFVQRGELHANYIRKMQSSFSWDWGPSFPTQGIWKSTEILAFDSTIIRDILVQTIPQKNNKWIINTSLHFESIYTNPFEGLLQISVYDTIIYRKLMTLSPTPDGNARVDLQIAINDSLVIHPWFPNGMGSQMLYELKAIVTTTEDTLSKAIRFGFRTVELIEEVIPPKGLTFYFKVNGVPMYAKGSNWIPGHVFQEVLTADYIRHLLESCKEANMNMIRVWGGGVYESDLFYEIADELGIMIWHDFMFACALYPTTNQFLDSVSVEVIQQVRRLQHHPSIALWAGNNENEVAIAQHWWPEIWVDAGLYKRDYIKLYVNTIRDIVIKEDNSRPFLTSSPSNGLETMKENYISAFPQDNRYGDVHFYYYGTNAWEWSTYPSNKFASEYGFQSFPSLKTLSKVVNSSDLRYPLSDAIIQRQHHTNGNNEMSSLIEHYMTLPVSGGKDRFNDFIYLSQIAQAMSLKTETEFYRRNRFIDPNSGEGFTMGALYWQLNDIWPAPTWASIEFGGKWKMSHYFAKNMFKDLLVVPFEDNHVLKVAVVRDDYSGVIPLDLTIRVFKWSSLQPLLQIHNQIQSTSFSAEILYQNLTSNVLSAANCVDRNECVIEVMAENVAKNWKSNNFLFLGLLRNALTLKRPNLRVKSISGPHNYLPNYVYDIVLDTDSIAPFVWLDFTLDSDIIGEFSDNGFVMFSANKLIQFYSRTPVKAEVLRFQLTVQSLRDVKTESIEPGKLFYYSKGMN